MPPKGEMTELVKRVMRDAHIDTTDDELAAQIAPHLGGHLYESSALASWRSGRYRPPAEAIFAVALARGISLDEILYGKSLRQEFVALREEFAAVADLVRGRGDRGSP